MDTSGFYKLEENNLLFGPNFVLNENYSLRRESYDTNTYPIDGWYWFDSEDEARIFFELPPREIEPEIPGIPEF